MYYSLYFCYSFSAMHFFFVYELGQKNQLKKIVKLSANHLEKGMNIE